MEHNFGYMNPGNRMPSDAVHVPVIQVYTLEEGLMPGDHVYFDTNERVSKCKDYNGAIGAAGFVDPFGSWSTPQ